MVPDIAERRHRTAQAIGLFGVNSAAIDRDLHRLLLEQGHAEGPVQDRLQLLARIPHLLLALPTAKIGMHHVALDRPRPHNRDFNDQIVELARTQARQHVHLSAAFDLKHAERLAAAQHVVDRRVLLGWTGVRDYRRLMICDQVETLADAGQHAQRQHIDLHQAQRVDVVLVPFDEGAVRHRGIADRHIGVEPVLREHIAADMLRQMPGKFEHARRRARPPPEISGLSGSSPAWRILHLR